MISSIHIKNFKSVVDLSIDLGRINVFVGENGCGKTNILEAIAFGAAASAGKLDFEFMGSRGIRLTKPEFMFSAFSKTKKDKKISLDFKVSSKLIQFRLINYEKFPKTWVNVVSEEGLRGVMEIIRKAYKENKENPENEDSVISQLTELFPTADLIENNLVDLMPNVLSKIFSDDQLSNFIIYSPEESYLRKFEDTAQIYPLGIKGEGLFQYIKEISLKKKSPILKKIKENLILLDWFDDFNLPKNLMSNEYALQIRDKYLHEDLSYFDQKSTNEGFLYLLFYFTLFSSDITPKFFAVDNIDSSLNPKLCIKLTSTLAKLAKENDKQAILTTHNPAILDGLDLKDDEQRLFVVSRNIDGHTKVRRIMHKPEREKKLSEIWAGGFIGGLPDNF
jgi:AAA15 family ATPase/GTPase